ncbi:hypothetical protein GP486_003067 [Trichoglossum hirsutum]|uniref:Uncharacterized protein n=1 Tax=Trichoglossum hirsutum TaxID=265104 RepID=A0A9P8LDW2_9PEZI|nr:hypothetical protein GP486_003067 [Trichoglossum hirsutum]
MESLVGRDAKRWYGLSARAVSRAFTHTRSNHVLSNAAVSNIHLRIYCVLYEESPPLVYCEDLSRNGTLWNSVIIGRGKGGVLLSEGDRITISRAVELTFHQNLTPAIEQVNEVQEVEKKLFADRYTITNRILGKGGYGTVYMAINQVTKRQLACKIVDLRTPLSPEGHVEGIGAKNSGTKRKRMDIEANRNRKGWMREVEILQSLSHVRWCATLEAWLLIFRKPNIIGLEKVFRSENTMYIFEDLITAGDMFSYLDIRGSLKDTEAAVIVKQVLKGLEYLHQNNIVHRDLKPDNILVTSVRAGSRVLLADFGCARVVKDIWSRRMNTVIGTPEYTAPEVHPRGRMAKGKGYTKSIDMWSLGVVTVQLLTGRCFLSESEYPGESEDRRARLACWRLLRRMESGQEEWDNVGARPKDFVKKLIVPDAEKRMTVQQALNHSWFTNKAHRALFEDLYKRAIRDWAPRTRCPNTIEDINLPILKQGTVEPSRDGTVSIHFTGPSGSSPSIEQTNCGNPPSTLEGIPPSTLHAPGSGVIAMRAPIAKMYGVGDTHYSFMATCLKRGDAERSEPLAWGFNPLPRQSAANDRIPGGHETYADSTKQILPVWIGRRTHGVHFVEPQGYRAKPTKRTRI